MKNKLCTSSGKNNLEAPEIKLETRVRSSRQSRLTQQSQGFAISLSVNDALVSSFYNRASAQESIYIAYYVL